MFITLAFVCGVHADTPAADKYGVDAGPWKTSAYLAECDHIIASGVKWVRMIPPWSSIETGNNVYSTSYLAVLDKCIDRFQAAGVQVVFNLGLTPQWASTLPTAPWPDYARAKPSSWIYWDDYVSFMAVRYKNKVQYWEIWNEPDSTGYWTGTVADYAQLLTRAYPLLKSASASNVVLFGGLAMQSDASTESYGLGSFFDLALAISGVSSSFDVANYHAYGSSDRQIKLHTGMRDVTTKYGIQSKPLWITETGYSQSASTSDLEDIKADMVDQAWSLVENLGDVERVFYHHYRNLSSGNFQEDNFGLTTSGLTPLPALYRYEALGGAETDPQLQLLYPTQTASVRPLYHYAEATGMASYVKAGLLIPATGYGYYRVYDSWAFDVNETFYADITYLDEGAGGFSLQYDNATNAYASVPVTKAGGNTGNWITTTVTLPNARFANSQNYFSDLRLSSTTSALFVKSLVIRRASDSSSYALACLSPATGDGSMVVTQNRIPATRYMLFKVNDGWMNNNQNGVDQTIYADITYLDVGSGNFALHYESTADAFQSISIPRAATGTGAWLTATVTLANAKLANGQNGGTDMRLYSGGSDLTVKSVVLYRSLNPGAVRFDSTPDVKMMRPVFDTDSSHEGYTVQTTMGGVECRQITGNGKYQYVDVSAALVPPDHTNITISVTFWDAGTDRLAVYWGSTAVSGVSGASIVKTNTSAWRTVSVPVTNAKLVNQLSYGCDIRVNNWGDSSVEYISRIEVTSN